MITVPEHLTGASHPAVAVACRSAERIAEHVSAERYEDEPWLAVDRLHALHREYRATAGMGHALEACQSIFNPLEDSDGLISLKELCLIVVVLQREFDHLVLQALVDRLGT